MTGSSTNTPAGACTGTTTLDCLSGTYDFYNVFAASYGIVVIASDNSNVGSGLYHKAAIDYMAKQNADPSSPFYKKLSTRVGTSGHSQGGIGATAGADLIGPNCQAEVCIAGGGSVQKTNAFICLTGSADQAEAACTATYQSAPGPAFLADWDGGDHFTTETLAGYVAGQDGTHQLMHLYAAWFRCFLADDQTACKLFRAARRVVAASARTRAGTCWRRRTSSSAHESRRGRDDVLCKVGRGIRDVHRTRRNCLRRRHRKQRGAGARAGIDLRWLRAVRAAGAIRGAAAAGPETRRMTPVREG